MHGGDGTDELSIAAPSEVVALEDGALRAFVVHPEDAGLPLHPFEDLLGGDPAQNARELRAVLGGAGRTAYRDAVLLNAAAALVVADRVSDLKAGVEMARESITSGAAESKLTGLAERMPIG